MFDHVYEAADDPGDFFFFFNFKESTIMRNKELLSKY